MADAEYPLLSVLRWRHLVRQLKHILRIRAYFHNLGEYLKQFAALKAPPQYRRPIRWHSSATASPKAKAKPKAKASSCLPSSSSQRLEIAEEATEEWIHLGHEPDPETRGSDGD